MKRIIFSAIIALMAMVSASAKEYIETKLFINSKTGDVATFLFKNMPEATIVGDNIVITTDDGDQVEYPIDNVRDFTFLSETKVGLDQITGDSANNLLISVTRTLVTIDGMAEGQSFDIYSMAGLKVASATSADGHAEVSIESLAPGVYIVSAPGHTFKFIK